MSDIMSLSATHSVLSHAHAVLEGATEQHLALPDLKPAHQVGLLAFAMSLSTRLMDPDELVPKLAKAKAVDVKHVIRAQCQWVNLMGQLENTFMDC